MTRFVLFLFVLGSLFAHSQRFKVDLGFGYGLGLTSTYMTSGYSEANQDNGDFFYNLNSDKINFNEGFTSHLKFNYAINQELFAVIGARHQFGKREIDELRINYTGTNTLDIREVNKYEYDQLDVQIGLGVEKQIGEKWSLSMSHGFTFFVLGKYKHTIEETRTGNLAGYNDYKKSRVYKPSFTFGAYGDIALNYKISNNFSLFLNTTVQAKNWSSKSSKISEFEVDGVDQIPTSSVSQLESEYSSSISSVVSWPDNWPDPEKPTEELKSWSPNSGIETVFGFRYEFGKEPVLKDTMNRSTGFYLNLSGGYGTPINELTNIKTETIDFETVQPATTSQFESELFSYGRGLALNFTLGYNLRNLIGFEIGVDFNNSEYKSNIDHNFFNFFNQILSRSVAHKNSAWMLRNTYGVKFETDFKRINAFARTGLSIGFAGVTERSDSTIQHFFPSSTEQFKLDYEYTGGVSIGGYIGLGASLRLSNYLDLVAEAVTYIQNWSPKRRENTVNEIDYVDQLTGMSYSEIHTEYVEELESSSSNMDPNIAKEELRTVFPFSSFQMTLGLRFNLGKN